MTGGALAVMIAHILSDRYGDRAPAFEKLGKPHSFIYEEGMVRAGVNKRDVVMIGDQLATDVRGALEFGIDAALVTTGLTTLSNVDDQWSVRPTWLIDDLSL